ncbi:MAG: hypothetical protein WCC66_13495 [Rhizobiaceae bacterium]
MTDNLDKARSLSRAMRLVMALLGVLVAAVTLWFSLKAATDGDWLAGMLQRQFGSFAPLSVSPLQKGLFIVADLLQTGAILIALGLLARAFGQISRTGGVDHGTAIGVRRAGIWFGIAALLLVLSTPINALIASIGQPQGRRFLSIGLETQHLLALLLSVVLITLGHVLALASDIAEDNRQIV